jgi:hypothetical protein
MVCLRIRLLDRASVCWIVGRNMDTVDEISKKIIENKTLVQLHPLYILSLLLEERTHRYMAWYSSLKLKTCELESATTMIDPGWAMVLTSDKRAELSNMSTLLQRLHGVGAHLAHMNTMLLFAEKLGTFALETLDEVETLRASSGLPRLKSAPDAGFREKVKFTLSRVDFCQHMTAETRERASSQIPVVSTVSAVYLYSPLNC